MNTKFNIGDKVSYAFGVDNNCGPKILVSETIYFENTFKDTHNAFDKDKKIYTIVKSGFYFVKKYYNAGDIIENPEMVRSE